MSSSVRLEHCVYWTFKIPYTKIRFCTYFGQVIFNKNRKEKLELIDGLQLRKPNAPPLPKVSQVSVFQKQTVEVRIASHLLWSSLWATKMDSMWWFCFLCIAGGSFNLGWERSCFRHQLCTKAQGVSFSKQIYVSLDKKKSSHPLLTALKRKECVKMNECQTFSCMCNGYTLTAFRNAIVDGLTSWRLHKFWKGVFF